MSYTQKVLDELKARYPEQPEFIQAATEILGTIQPALDAHPEYEEAALLERLVEPERIVMFRVPWVDDQGKVQVNRGYRVEFNSAIGPYKGGLRFNPTVTLGMLKFLGLEQILKNSLTTLPMGGGKGGSDFDPKGKSNNEIMHFCQSFMTELYRHIGPNTDVPAGDLGVGGREVAYMFGQYKRLTNEWTGVLTGKGLSFGARSPVPRPPATAWSTLWTSTSRAAATPSRARTSSFTVPATLLSMPSRRSPSSAARCLPAPIPTAGSRIPTASTTPCSSTSTTRSAPATTRASRSPCTLTRSPTPCGTRATAARVGAALRHRAALRSREHAAARGRPGARRQRLQGGRRGRKHAHDHRGHDLLPGERRRFMPGKAANAGGVLVSGLEMSQNAEHLSWTFEEVDGKLEQLMRGMFHNVDDTAKEYGEEGNFVMGANIAGFLKVADAMLAQGVC